MSDKKKTKQQLIDELEALRAQLAGQEGKGAGEAGEPSLAGPMTRRTVLTNWVAPVVLSIPLSAMTRTAAAQPVPTPLQRTPIPSFEPTPIPSFEPSPIPSPQPSPMPSFQPSPVPSPQPSPMPFPQPTPMPSMTPTAIPTAFPTAFPTATEFGCDRD